MLEGPIYYEPWNIEQPQIPPRSRFYHLPPVGVGAPHVESLTGYTARLAEAHSVSTGIIFSELASLMNKDYCLVSKRNKLFFQFRFPVQAINGTGDFVACLVQTVEALTLRRDLRFLSMLTWQDVISPIKMLRSVRAWCPACYEEWRVNDNIIYEPLIWAIETVKICVLHRQRLCFRCPYCEKDLPLLTLSTRPGHCSKCHNWLGMSLIDASNLVQPLTEDELKWEVWVVTAIGELLAAAPSLSSLPSREIITRAIGTYIDQLADGRFIEFASLLRRRKSTIWYWKQGKLRIQLENLLQVCYCIGNSPLEALTVDTFADPDKVAFASKRDAVIKPKRAQLRRPFDSEKVRDALQSAVSEEPPPSVCEVARRVGYDVRFLYRHFSALCQLVSSRHAKYEKACVDKKREEFREEVRSAVFKVYASGLYPSPSRVAALLTKPKNIHRDDARVAMREAIRELDLD